VRRELERATLAALSAATPDDESVADTTPGGDIVHACGASGVTKGRWHMRCGTFLESEPGCALCYCLPFGGKIDKGGMSMAGAGVAGGRRLAIIAWARPPLKGYRGTAGNSPLSALRCGHEDTKLPARGGPQAELGALICRRTGGVVLRARNWTVPHVVQGDMPRWKGVWCQRLQ